MSDPGPDQELHDWMDMEGTTDQTEEARRLIQAMRQTGDALSPSEQTRQATWARIAQAMTTKQKKQSGFDEFFRHFMSSFSPGMATATLILGVTVLLWAYLPNEQAEFTDMGTKGPPHVIAIHDFSSSNPALVKELSDMGLSFDYRPGAKEGVLTIQVTDPPSLALLQWASRWNLLPPLPGPWHLKVVPESPTSP